MRWAQGLPLIAVPATCIGVLVGRCRLCIHGSAFVRVYAEHLGLRTILPWMLVLLIHGSAIVRVYAEHLGLHTILPWMLVLLTG